MKNVDPALVQAALAAISGKWRVPVMCKLCCGPRRFGELMRELPGVRHKVLADQLRGLEADGFIERSDLSKGSSLHVEYRCTPAGYALGPLLAGLAALRCKALAILNARAQQARPSAPALESA